jgi:hypothetical protein
MTNGALIKTNVCLQVGDRLTIGKKIGPPAQTIVRILIEIVLNLIALLFLYYLIFMQYNYKQ